MGFGYNPDGCFQTYDRHGVNRGKAQHHLLFTEQLAGQFLGRIPFQQLLQSWVERFKPERLWGYEQRSEFAQFQQSRRIQSERRS